MSGTTDTTIVVGAASKGIIQRDHQHNVAAYKTYYAPNPFDSMTEDEIAQYKDEVERKARGESATGMWFTNALLINNCLKEIQ